MNFKAHDKVQRGLLWIFVAQLGVFVGIEAVILAVLGNDESFNTAYKYPSLQTIGIATSLYPIFAAIGAISVLYLVHVTSNIILMVISLIVWICGFFIGGFVVGSIGALMASRILKGLAIGCLTSVLPLYIEKVSASTNQTAQLLTLLQASVPCGILLMALVGKLNIDHNYMQRWMFAALPTFPILILVCNLPRESNVITQTVELKMINSPKTSSFQLFKRDLLKLKKSNGTDAWLRCIAASLAQAAGPTTAINVIFYYSSTMCQMLGFRDKEADYLSIGLYACNAFGTSLSLIFINRLPRVPTLQFSILGMAFMHIGLFATQLAQSYRPECTALGMLSIALIFGFVFIFSLLFAGVQLVYTSEVVSPYTRATSIGIATACGWLWNFIIAFMSAYVLPLIGSFIFLLFAQLCCAVFILFCFMPR